MKSIAARDEDLLRRAHFVRAAGATGALVGVAYAVEALVSARWGSAAGALGLAHVCAGAAVCARAERMRLAIGLGVGAVVLSGLGVILLAGTSAVRLGILLPGIMFVGFVVRGWLAPLYALVLVGLVAGGSQAPGLGLPLAPSGGPVAFDVVLQIVAATALVVAFARGFRRLLARRRDRAQALDRLHTELCAAHARLEARVASQAEELERATRDLDAFVALIAHDLKAPLRHLIGFIGFCMHARVPEGTRARLAEAHAATRAMAERVTELVERERERVDGARVTAAPKP